MTSKSSSYLRLDVRGRVKRHRRIIADRYTSSSYRQATARACERAFPLPLHLQPQQVEQPDRRSRREKPAEWRSRLGAGGMAEVRAWRKQHTWTPRSLRHTPGTAIRKEFRIEMARIILGHS